MSQSLIGADKFELDTPILCIDREVMESNIRKMAGFISSRGKQWRPHMKCHKTPTIALGKLRPAPSASPARRSRKPK